MVFTLPGTTWADVEQFQPPHLLALIRDGASGSMSVRTDAARTLPADAFATIGAGTRMSGGRTTGGSSGGVPLARRAGGGGAALYRGVKASGLAELRRLARSSTYDPKPGALGSALGERGIPLGALGNGDLGMRPGPGRLGRWTLLAAMDSAGVVELAATGPELLERAPRAPFGVRTNQGAITAAAKDALSLGCSSLVVEHGDLTRVDRAEAAAGARLARARGPALLRADALLGRLRGLLDEDKDLLLVLSSTSPAADRDVHFGVAAGLGPGFRGGGQLTSPSTRRAGIVTLPDVAPTVVEHLGIERPASMLGRSWFEAEKLQEDPLGAAVELDEEATFVDRVRTPVSTVFVVFQVIVYLLIILALQLRGSKVAAGGLGRWLELAALGVVALPAATYLMGGVDQHALGIYVFAASLLVLDAALVAATAWMLERPLDRLLALTAFTLALLLIDGVTGARLQLNTVFSYSPLVAGRFAGFGNIAYSVLAATSLITGTLLIHRFGASRRVLVAVAALFVLTIVVDGAPQFGSDVGGIIALVPGLGFAWMLLSGRRPTVKMILLGALALALALTAFVAVDLLLPSESRTHLARLVEDVRARGGEALADTVVRKARTNLRVFGSTIWTYLVPPALALIAWVFLRRKGTWSRFAITHPRLRAGLVSGLVLAVLGFAVNDSGIVIPALMLSYLVPLALLIHLSLERGVLSADEHVRDTLPTPAHAR